jgi:hypothetical protein
MESCPTDKSKGMLLSILQYIVFEGSVVLYD